VHRSIVIALAVAAIAAPSAAADGLPVLGIDDGSSGVTVPGAVSRYVTIQAPGGGTLVERINRDGGQVLASSLFSGTFTIPAVAYDGSAGGLSADRHTLVLIQPRTSFPRKTTRLLVLHVPSLRHRALVELRGDFSFDAVSPGGSRIYLINYLSATDPTRYAVRSYDVDAMRLDPRPVVDPRNPREKMRGNPLSRATGADGRWAYTLYDGGGGTPFVHALDTRDAAARCIDLAGLDPARLTYLRLRLSDGGRSVDVVDGSARVLDIDTRALAVRVPHARPWWRRAGLLAIAALVAGAAIGLGSRHGRARRRPARGSALRRPQSAPAEAPRD
jgi:hypothetical protein